MKSAKLTLLMLVAACLLVVLAWGQEAKSPDGKSEGGKTQGNIGTIKAERKALQREAEAIEARHQALDAEIATWSEDVGRWIKDKGITIDPAKVVLSLSSRSYFLHESQHAGASSGDPEYSRLEDQMKDIQAKRKEIESDWLNLLSRDRASIARHHLKPIETKKEFDFDLGDSTIPIPGISARQSCCAMFLPGGGCKLVAELCVKNDSGKGWHLVCSYLCEPLILEIPR